MVIAYWTAWIVTTASPWFVPPLGRWLGFGSHNVFSRHSGWWDVLFWCLVPVCMLGVCVVIALAQRRPRLAWWVGASLFALCCMGSSALSG